MTDTDELLGNNRKWADQIKQVHPDFFGTLAEGQQPTFLWYGCSDSRVPPGVITQMMPGEIFVHRNIANLVEPGDLSSQSVLQFAVNILEVNHIIICGHYRCGGIEAALGEENFGLLDQWVGQIKQIVRNHEEELAGLKDQRKRIDRMCEINVKTQLTNVCHSPFVRNAWANGRSLSVHGWIYDLEEGYIKDLNLRVDGPEDLN